jgi:hypothetical protein
MSSQHERDTSSLQRFDPEALSEATIARRIGILVTRASEEYRRALSGRHGDALEQERHNLRREFVTDAFQQFGMLDKHDSDEFRQTSYDPAERQLQQSLQHTGRREATSLVERRFGHPVIRAGSSWTRISGESNEKMRDDSVRATRVAAFILENMGEAEYQEDLEL